MDTFWALTNYLPLLVCGLIYYCLFVVVPRWFKSKFSADEGKAGKRPAAVRANTTPNASGGSSAPSKAPREAVSETVSVVLRRQVPPRFDETVRSWLGGLPRMPEEIAWPRSISSEKPDQGERPLHFVAQICCADLPPELWGGLGPREGWLLLFLDPNQGTPEGSDAFQVVHVPQLGPDRVPPFDLGPVHDGVYTGPDYRYLLPGETVPRVWRRWPVDVVVVANQARKQDGRVLVAPDNFASLLYPDQKVADEYARPAAVPPFTFGQALYALHELRADLQRTVRPVELSAALCAALRREGAILERRTVCAGKAGKYREGSGESGERAGGTDEQGQPVTRSGLQSANAARFEREEAWLREMGDADSVIRYLEESSALEQAWQDRVLERIDTVIEAVRQREPETPLAQAEWNEMVVALRGQGFSRWQCDRLREDPGQTGIAFREHARWAELRPSRGMQEFVADMYTDASRQALIPDYALAEYEPHWRRLCSNRPHRLGGYHDGLQSDATVGPASELLLFQIASDDAMHWCWGDVGAYYFWIRPGHLAARDFSGVQMHLECH